MLPGLMSIGGFVGGDAMSAAYLADYSIAVGSSQITGNIDVPEPSTNRRVVLSVGWRGGATPRSLSDGTIGGVNIAIHRQLNLTGGVGSLGHAIVSAIVPSGTTAIPVVLNFSGSIGPDSHLGVWRLQGYNNIVATGALLSADPTAPLSTTVATQTPGFVVGGYSGSSGTSGVAITWTNATERFDVDDGDRFGGADTDGTGSNISVGASQGAISSAGNILTVVSFGV